MGREGVGLQDARMGAYVFSSHVISNGTSGTAVIMRKSMNKNRIFCLGLLDGAAWTGENVDGDSHEGFKKSESVGQGKKQEKT